MQVYSPGALLELPSSNQAARVCPNGRPPHPFISFGFGGSVLVVRSGEQLAEGAAEAPLAGVDCNWHAVCCVFLHVRACLIFLT